jgi:outer membrane protein OmpA-like peptidoglycan-associated protein
MKISRVLSGSLIVLTLFMGAGFVFGQDIARRTTAITYPLNERVTVQFRGTTRFPRMGGRATIRRTQRNGSEVDLSVFKMPRPFELGAGYATYVLWAVSPEGQVDNLGEIKRRGFFEFDSRIRVTTKLQTFSLIITAEPHFLVSRPSQEIMLENLNPVARSGRSIPTTVAVQYFGNSSDFFRDPRTPEIAELDYSRTPSTILQAKQAVALARFAEADRYSAQTLTEAEELLSNAEEAWRAGRREADVDVVARRAISTAVNAETLAFEGRAARQQRDEQMRTDAEIRSIEDRLRDAQNEVASLKAQLADETRSRELSERDVQNFTQQLRELRAENGRLREELGRAQIEIANTRTRLATYEAAERTVEEQRQREERWNLIQANQPNLMQALRKFGTVGRNERGIVLTLPENFWASARSANFSPTADTTLNSLAEILANNPDYKITIESHTDDQGSPDELEALTRNRSRAVAERLSDHGVANGRLDPRGFGASIPVAPNTTNANRARNRRVQLVLVPAI